MNTEHTKHPCETVDASADVMKLAEMILSDCGCSTAISDRLQRRVAGRIQQHMDSALGGQQQAEPVAYGKTPGCKQCDEAEACGLTFCPECDAQFCEGHDGAEEGAAQPPAVATDSITDAMEANAWRAALRGLCTGRELMTPDECAEHVRHRIESAKSGTHRPDGYALVPIKPTDTMLDAAVSAGDEPGSDYYTIYAAMLAAAQKGGEA